MDAGEGYGRSLLGSLHLTVGIVGIVVFLITGQFMDRQLDHLRGMADGPRALYRSAHIYILFAALLNLILGAYSKVAATKIGWVVQAVASVALVIALGLFIYGFYWETPLAGVERPMVRLGIELSLWGSLLHGIAGYAAGATNRGKGIDTASRTASNCGLE